MALKVTDAPRAARSLTKRASFVRRELSQLSKSEEQRVPGAAQERQRLTASFCQEAGRADELARDTERAAGSFARAALCLRQPETPATDALSRLAAMTARMGLSAARSAALAELCVHASQRATEAAQRAQDRLDDNADDIAATRTLGEMLERLPSCGWNPKNRAVKRLRETYLHHTRAIAAQRKPK